MSLVNCSCSRANGSLVRRILGEVGLFVGLVRFLNFAERQVLRLTQCVPSAVTI